MFSALVAGGTGVFGSIICERLARHGDIRVLVGGRQTVASKALCARIRSVWPKARVEPVGFDLRRQLPQTLERTRAKLLVNATGPFRGRDYRAARQCIEAGVHYVDIADGRVFVTGISRLDGAARRAGVSVVSGASSVPGLSSTVACELARKVSRVDRIGIGITPGNRSPRGLATVESILGYVGKPIAGTGPNPAFGWQDLRTRSLQIAGKAPLRRRLFSACDVPDLALLPQRFPSLERAEFHAGLEVKTLHLGLWLLSWMVRSGVVSSLEPWTRWLRTVASWCYPLGSDRGGMYVELLGRSERGDRLEYGWTLIAERGSGVVVPATPAVILARRLAEGRGGARGATPCFDMFSLTDFLGEIDDLPIACQLDEKIRYPAPTGAPSNVVKATACYFR